MPKPCVRCAVYTRKSSEEGLEQSFNSIEAQQEACRDFIRSQKHEGWTALAKRYDDGGFSGGSMERPALKELLSDIQAGQVDTVVVYKVDRLTRSLADFAKMIEIFDSHKISFVSVTQQFNTTTSMGRLTLNVLLSFAQFEREITGERIRDKIAASKKKGMWMGGTVPLGYDCIDHRLVTNKADADTVRSIFRYYLRLGSVNKLKDFLDSKQIRAKVRTSVSGRTHGGGAFARGALYHLLRNRVYIGEIVHKEVSYQGEHQPVVSPKLWNQAAAHLKENNRAQRVGKSCSTPSLLSGKLFDTSGVRFTPTHAVKNGKRYRYYTSQTVVRQKGVRPAIARFPAHQLEQFIISQVHLLLKTPEKFTAATKKNPGDFSLADRADEMAKKWLNLETSVQHEFASSILRRVIVGQTTVWTEIDKSRFLAALSGQDGGDATVTSTGRSALIKLSGKLQILRRGSELLVIAPHHKSTSEWNRVPSLVNLVARTRDWYERIVSGEIQSIDQFAKQSGTSPRYIQRILRCATLSPKIVEALLAGKHRPNVSVKQLLNCSALEWEQQEQGIFQT